MIKPFKLDNLKKVSRREQELIHALYEFLPATEVREKVHVAIRKALIKHLGRDIRYFLSSVETISFNEFSTALPECPVVVVLGLAPIGKKLIIHVDHHIANLLINKLLGGGDVTMGEVKPLTETEQGVMQYLVMQILSQIYSSGGAEPRVHFRMDRFLFDPGDVRKLVDAREKVCILTVNVTIFDQSGFIRLVFPDPFLEEIVNLSEGAGQTKGERKYFGHALHKWGFVKTSVWGEAGNSLLNPVEIRDLEPGDVILFDESDLKLTGGEMKGNIVLHFGAGGKGVDASLVESGAKTIKCKLGGIR